MNRRKKLQANLPKTDDAEVLRQKMSSISGRGGFRRGGTNDLNT